MSIGGSVSTLANRNPIRYRGYYYDVESDLYYLQSRYYDAAVGRFINADGYVSTNQSITSCNTFGYCNNSPIIYQDSTGCFPWLVVLVLAGGAILGGYYGYTSETSLIKKFDQQPMEPLKSTTPPPPLQQNVGRSSPRDNAYCYANRNSGNTFNSHTATAPQNSINGDTYALFTGDRLVNTALGAVYGLGCAGLVLSLGCVLAAPVYGSTIYYAAIGGTTVQTFARGLIVYDLALITVGPVIGTENEPIELYNK